MYRFFVAGTPVPQGSLKFINGRPIHQGAQRLALWRADIARRASEELPIKYTEEVYCHLWFGLQKPKSVKRVAPFVRPDIDKLIRAVLDGLTGVAFDDDAQVTNIQADKTYKDNPGVWIQLWSPNVSINKSYVMRDRTIR